MGAYFNSCHLVVATMYEKGSEEIRKTNKERNIIVNRSKWEMQNIRRMSYKTLEVGRNRLVES